MRLRELRYKLEKALQNIHIELVSVQNSTNKEIIGAQLSVYWINNLSDTGLIDQLIDQLMEKHNSIYISKNRKDVIRVSSEEALSFQAYINSVRSHLVSLINMSNYIAPETKPYSIDIKLPDAYEFNEVDKTIHKLNQAFKTVLRDKEIVGEDNKDIEVTSFENGSIWITIALAGVNTYLLLSKLINIALDIQNKYYTNQIAKEKLAQARIDTAILKDLCDRIDSDIEEEIIERVTELIKNEDDSDLSEEQKTKARGAINNFADIIFKGGEFHDVKSKDDHRSQTEILLPGAEEYKRIRESIRLTTEERTRISEKVDEIQDQIEE